MTMRVAFLAAECEPWAKTGGLADVVDALARALGRLPEAGSILHAPVDVFLPRYRGVPVPDTAVRPSGRRAGSRTRPAGPAITAGIVDVPADGYRLRLVDVPGGLRSRRLLRDRDSATTPGGSACSAGPRSRRSAPMARPSTSSTSTTGTPDRPLLERARGDAGRDPIFGRMAVTVTLHNLAYHGWTPRRILPQLGLAPGERARRPEPGRARPAADGDRARGARQHRLARVRRARR